MRDAVLMFELRATLRASDHRNGQPIEWFSVQFHPTEPTLYGLGRDYRTTVWEIPSGRYLHSIGQTSDWIIAQAISPDGAMLAVGSADHFLVLWDLVHHEPLVCKDLGDHVCAVAFSPDGRFLATGHYGEGPIRVWNSADGSHAATIIAAATWTNALAFSPDGRFLAAADTPEEDRFILRLWTVGQWQEAMHVSLAFEVTSLAFHPVGRLLAGGAVDGHIYLWSTETGQLAPSIPGHHDRVRSVAYSPTGELLVSGGVDPAVQLWDGNTGKPRATLIDHADAVTSVAFDRTGALLASASLDRTVKLWTVNGTSA